MWIYTRDGFYSVVEYDPKEDDRKNSPFARFAKVRGSHMLVRTRAREHLEALRKVVKNIRIEEDPSADYLYRAVIPRKKWKQYVATAVDDIDYVSHFKEVVRDAQPAQLKQPMYSAMMRVWSAMMDLQPFQAWWGKTGPVALGKGTATTTQTTTVEDLDFEEIDLTLNEDDDWYPASERIYLSDAMNIIRQRGKAELTTLEVGRATDAAWEFYLALQDAVGAGGTFTEEDLIAAREESFDRTGDAYAFGQNTKGEKK